MTRSLAPARPACRSRRRPTALAIVVLGLAIGPLAACDRPPSPAELRRLVHATSLSSFAGWWERGQAQVHRTTVAQVRRWLRDRPAHLDDATARRGPWDLSTDRCSVVPDRGPSFDFRWPCIRHDFAWRNLRRLDPTGRRGLNTRAERRAASLRFLADMRERCRLRPWWRRPGCETVARTYYLGTMLAA